MKIFKKLILYIHTIKYLKLRQIYYRLIFLLKNRFVKLFIVKIVDRINCEKIPEKFSLKHKIQSPTSCVLKNSNFEFFFLNKKVLYTGTIDWEDKNQDQLWLYNLHYFDFLLQSESNNNINFNFSEDIIASWIRNNPVGKGVGWEPYPLSLRIVNWIFFYNKFSKQFQNEKKIESVFINSIYKQCSYLAQFIEYHILANHLFKNGKALFIAGIFFDNQKLQLKGSRILTKEINEQILSDGGHFERSPMYHAITLEDILDLFNIIQSYNHGSEYLLDSLNLEKLATRMLKWLAYIIQPDGEIPIIGDSAFKIAPKLSSLVDYYEKVTGRFINQSKFKKSISLKDSGYYVFRSEDQYMVVDGGQLGVSYQPGHAHCDLLSFEYSYKNNRVFIDTGVGDYNDSDLRQKARSVKGHNTVMVNNLEQGEIWAAFRMGKRVNPGKIVFDNKKEFPKFSGEYENNLNRKFNYKHQREITFYMDKIFLINDYVKGENLQEIRSFFHLVPEAKLEINTKQIIIKINNNIIYLYLKHQYSVDVNNWFYTPEFGIVLDTQAITISNSSTNGTKFSYIICPEKYKVMAEEYISKYWIE